MAEDWTKWESQVINGVFPLRRFLGRSDHSVVFLTEFRRPESLDAAIKLVPADAERSEAQLAHWKVVASLSHPHLIRLLEAGRCRLGGQEFLFVVMEYAEQNLSQILPQRALTADEVREMLLPTLDALAFLHRNELVQGQLKPPNILVVGDQLKLASDTIRRAGESAASIAKPSSYEPPEAKSGAISAAGDIWGLGMTVVEALTQLPPVSPDDRSDAAPLPATLPPEFMDTVRRCLSRDPAKRPTAAELQAQFKGPPQAPAVRVAPPAAREAPGGVAPPMKWPGRRVLVVTGAALLTVLVAVSAGLLLSRSRPDSLQTASSTAQTSSQQAAAPAAPSPNPQPSMSTPAPVLHEEIPAVSPSARAGIRGRIKVTVRVTVDASGNVVGETLEIPGPSKYFARLATDAARKWRFAAADNHDSRVWLLRFEFTRAGTTGSAAAPRS